MSSMGVLHFLRIHRVYNFREAFDTMSSTCKFHFRSSWIVIPNNFKCETVLSCTSFNVKSVRGFICLRKHTLIKLHLAGLGSTSFCWHHCETLSREFWRVGSWFRLTTSPRVRSSTYFHLFSTSVAASFTRIKNKIGPSLVPCGTPHDVCNRGEVYLPIFVLCVLLM